MSTVFQQTVPATTSILAPQTAMPNYEYVLPSGGVIAPAGGMDYQSASGSYYFQPNTPFVFYPEKEPEKDATTKRDVKVSKKTKKKKCGCC